MSANLVSAVRASGAFPALTSHPSYAVSPNLVPISPPRGTRAGNKTLPFLAPDAYFVPWPAECEGRPGRPAVYYYPPAASSADYSPERSAARMRPPVVERIGESQDYAAESRSADRLLQRKRAPRRAAADVGAEESIPRTVPPRRHIQGPVPPTRPEGWTCRAAGCAAHFEDWVALQRHAYSAAHASFACEFCKFSFVSLADLRFHVDRTRDAAHWATVDRGWRQHPDCRSDQLPRGHMCVFCHAHMRRYADLDLHATAAGCSHRYQVYQCYDGACARRTVPFKFSTYGGLKTHQEKFHPERYKKVANH